jgi:hypothetical protein
MISQIRAAAQIAVGMLKAKAADGDEPLNIDCAELLQIMQDSGMPIENYDYDGGFYSRTYHLVLGHSSATPTLRKATMTNPVTDNDRTDLFFDIRGNQMKLIVWNAYLRSVARYLDVLNFSNAECKSESLTINFGQLIEHSEWRYLKALAFMNAMAYAVIDKNDYVMARKVIEGKISVLAHELRNVKPAGSKSISNLFDKKPSSPNPSIQESVTVREQVEAAYLAMPSNALTSRTWGWEMEIADAKGVDAVFGVDKGDDGSLRAYEANSDCDCGCSDCVYHDCDCDNCDDRNDDPQHCNDRNCSSADSAEFRTKNGASRLKHPGLFKICDELEDVDAEVNDTCGVHIHVYALDLTTKQVAHVMAVYKWMENIFAIVAERDDTSYAKRLPVEFIQQAYAGKLPMDKPRAVNLTHIIAGSTAYLESARGTIEFRQMAGTYDAKRITIWAWIVRGLVEVMKRGAELKDFLGVKDINGLIEVYAKFKFFLHDENPELLIPGGQQDKKHLKLQLHERA